MNIRGITDPRHIAIIIDGNGRWAKKNGKDRNYGHLIGSRVVFDTLKTITELGVEFFTVYALSLENWKRPVEETSYLLDLFMHSMDEETIMNCNVRFRLLGRLDTLPQEVSDYLLGLEERTKANTGTVFTLCISYSGRWEIMEALRQALEIGKTAEPVSEQAIARLMPSSYLPNPDLIIRTGGESRLSNFMLWQSAYAELYFTDVLWPDFKREDLLYAIGYYQARERRFGNITT